jgi:citrate lyase subunit beta/citryl-CoA lyase
MNQSTVAPRRSVLCVPATDPRRISKALASGADEVVVDLEDSVAPADKAAARDVLAGYDWTAAPDGVRVAVRVNAPGTPWCHRDLEAVVALPVASVVLPKVERRGDLTFAERLLDGLEAEAYRTERLTIQALVETAAGLTHLHDVVADIDRLDTLLIGYADLAASLGRGPGLGAETWLPSQERVLSCARAAGLDAVDGPFLAVQDDEPFQAATDRAAALGFDAKWAIHPRQVSRINATFTPTEELVERSREVIAALDAGHAAGRGAVELDGELVDEAMALAARRVLARVGR